MDASQITPLQALQVYERLRPAFDYLVRLQRRMEQRGFDGNDRLYLEVKATRHDLQLLCKDLHALACRSYVEG